MGYKASDPGSKHYSGFFLFVLHVILLKETKLLQPMLPNANRQKSSRGYRETCPRAISDSPADAS